MKKLSAVVVLLSVLSLGSMIGVHIRSGQLARTQVAKMNERLAKERVTSELRVALERYRRQSAGMNKEAGVCAFFVGLILLDHYLRHARPLKILKRRLTEYEAAPLSPPPPRHRPLKGAYGQIERTLNVHSIAVAAQRKERLAFLTSVVDDLRTPDASRMERALDDLSDLVAIERSGLRLDDRIVDLTDLLTRVVHLAGGTASTHPVTFAAPALRTWALTDSPKMERAVLALLAKLRKLSPAGTPIAITLGRVAKGTGAFRDAEIRISERGAPRSNDGGTTREEGALHHWIHENGFGVALANRIVEAHGGKLSVSGAPGAAFQFILRIPEERIASGSALAMQASKASASAFALGTWLEGGRLDPVLSQQAINFRA